MKWKKSRYISIGGSAAYATLIHIYPNQPSSHLWHPTVTFTQIIFQDIQQSWYPLLNPNLASNGLKCQNQLPSLRFVSACDDQTAKKDDVASVTRDVTCDKNK